MSVAYWLDFGLAFIDNGNSALRWRFLLGFQCIPAILLFADIRFLPDSLHYYASTGRHEECKEVLGHLRGDWSSKVEDEYLEICAVIQNVKPSSPLQFAKVLFGRADDSQNSHLGRRAWLCIWLQIMASWTGITVGGALKSKQCPYQLLLVGCYCVLSSPFVQSWIQWAKGE